MLLKFENVKTGYLPDTEVTINDKKYRIHGVINGEDILVDTDKKYPSLHEVIKKSDKRIDNGCIFQNECGGCKFMHINYEYEKELKQKYITDLFKPFGLGNLEFTGMENPYNYRNKCQMTYKLSKSKKVVAGLYEEYSHNIISVSNCMLQSEKANEVIQVLNKILTKNKTKPYDEATRTGIIRHVFVRYGFNSKQLMLVIVTNGEMFPGRNNVIKDLNKENLGITTIVQNYNSRDTSIVLGDKERILYGPGFIYEYVGNYKFKISPKSFFQINTNGMNIIYNKALEHAKINKNDIVIDAYCGVGTISIFASKYAKKVYGVELNKNAIMDAKINAKINNIFNIEFLADDATNFMTHLAMNKEHVDVVIMDPPREGSTKQFIDAIGHLKPRRVIYISCDPTTLKRDLYLFSDNDYIIKHIEGVDMFPRTQHLESFAILERDEELDDLEMLVRENKRKNTKKYNENKLRYIPKADVEMMREDKYEASGNKKQKKYKY